jgi:hypothetical protein
MNQGDVMRCTPTQQSLRQAEEEDALTSPRCVVRLYARTARQKKCKFVVWSWLGNQQVGTAIYTKNYDHLNISLA